MIKEGLGYAAISGLNINKREGFNQMVQNALSGRINLILTKSLSRYARNTVDTISIIRKLKEKGIGIYFGKDCTKKRPFVHKLHKRAFLGFYQIFRGMLCIFMRSLCHLLLTCRLKLQRDIKR